MDKPKNNQKRICNIVQIVIFLTLIFAITIWSVLKPNTLKSETENRFLQTMPDLTTESLFDGSFGVDYEKYLCDQFIMRDSFMELKTKTEIALLKTDINDIYIGKDNYLIRKYNEESFNQTLVKKNISEISTFINKYAKLMGNEHVKTMLVPTSGYVLEDKLPILAKAYDESKFINEIKEKVPEGTVIDATDALKAHKDEYIYFKTDHHWTPLGAYYGYEQWAKATGNTPIGLEKYDKENVTKDFLGTNQAKICYAKEADSIDIYKYQDGTYQVLYDNLFEENKDDTKIQMGLFSYSKLKTKDKYEIFLDGNHSIVDIKTTTKNGKSLLVVKDSYAHCMLPYIINHFERVTVIDTRYFNRGVGSLEPDKNYTDILVLHNTAKVMDDNTVFRMNMDK